MGIDPLLPGSTVLDHSPAAVQPQVGCTLLIASVWLPTLVKKNSCLTTSPPFTLPKSNSGVANRIRGPDTTEGATATAAERKGGTGWAGGCGDAAVVGGGVAPAAPVV